MSLPIRIPDRLLRLGPWLLVITVVADVATIVLGLSVRQGYQQFAVQSREGPFASAALGLSYGIIGAILTARLPRNAVGWLLSGVGVAAGIATMCWYYVAYATFQNPPLLPAPEVVGWVAQVVAIPTAICLLILALALFPNGRVASHAWRWFPVLVAANLVLYAAATGFAPGDVFSFPGVRNPFGVEAIPRQAFEVVRIVSVLGSILIVAGAAISLFLRSRAANAIERHQLRWIAYAAIVNAIGTAAMSLAFGFTRPDQFGSGSATWSLAWLAFCLGATTIPIACLFAITRYRLYAIDRIISGTLVYAGLVAILAGLYAGLNELLRRTFVAVTGEQSDVALVITTLVLATTLTPVRQWLERVAASRLQRGDKAEASPDRAKPAGHAVPVASAVPAAEPAPAVQLSPEALDALVARAADLAAERVLERLGQERQEAREGSGP